MFGSTKQVALLFFCTIIIIFLSKKTNLHVSVNPLSDQKQNDIFNYDVQQCIAIWANWKIEEL